MRKRTAAQIEADKNRTGRPPKGESERKSERVTVYLTNAERADLEALARAQGVSLATLIMSRWREE